MKRGKSLSGSIRCFALTLFITSLGVHGWSQNPVPEAQQTSDGSVAAIQELRKEVQELREAMGAMQTETEQYRAENRELSRQVKALQAKESSTHSAGAGTYGSTATGSETSAVANSTETIASSSTSTQPLTNRLAALEDNFQLLNSKVDDQYQTKVESGSKYRVRLSGLVLLNLFSNRGITDNQDVPVIAIGPNQGNGDFGATVRQSEIGLEVFGPTLAGAKTSASLQADFAGGFSSTWNGVDSGIFRLRTASARFDWEHTSVVAGQDELFLSPLSPTSYASLAVPAFSYSGNLWAWTPQVRVEHRFDLTDDQTVIVQGGIFDNLTGEFPSDFYFRSAGPGEASGQPAYGSRLAWSQKRIGVPISIGVAGYYGHQDWGYGHKVDGWAGMMDWQIPLVSRLSLTGELYRGRAIAGLNGGIGRSVVYEGNPNDPETPIRGLDSAGGWSQLKFRATPKLEFNAAFGLDNPFASEARAASSSEPYAGPLWVQNRSILGNFIYRPRSNLLFSAEYRHLQSYELDWAHNNAQQINVMMGVFF